MQVTSRQSTLLGLFPQFENGELGGIQESARVAWQGISGKCSAQLICYSRESNGDQPDSRMRKILDAFNRDGQQDLILVWQIGLLKLLPFIRRRNGSRNILFLHGIEAWKQHDWLTRRLLSKVDLFLTNSDYTWKCFCKLNPSFESRPHETVPLGLSSPVETETSPTSDIPIALMLSRISKTEDYKGHRELIDAWPSVLQKKGDAQLWIAGEGDLRSELEQMVQLRKLESSIKFLGRVSEETKLELLEKCRCFVMPSRGEGFGLVYLEAMRMGRPCLVSTYDAGGEVVNPPEAGLAVDASDSDQVSSALLRLLSDGQEWRNWSNQARRRYEENYTATHFQERLVKAISLELKSAPPPIAGGLSFGTNP